MKQEKFSVARASWPEDEKAIRDIREKVFMVEQHVPKELEWDGEDQNALHLLARDADGHPVGTARLLPNGQVGRMAVLPAWRGRGIGSELLRELLRSTQRYRDQTLFLNAQTSAQQFYLKFGFEPRGDEFLEANIPHVRMVLRSDGVLQ